MSDDPETGILQSAEIELRNLDSIDYVPPTYPRYVPPEELKGEYNSGILEIDKKLYQLPCPLSEFTDDGWEISVGVTGNTSHTVLEAFGGRWTRCLLTEHGMESHISGLFIFSKIFLFLLAQFPGL